MTDCGNVEIRDLLPDLAAEALSPVERSRLQAHVDGCVECAAEIAVLRAARAVRPIAVPIDVAGIVARLPRPVSRAAQTDDRSVVSLDAHRASAKREPSRSTGRIRHTSGWSGSRSLWRMAAAMGVIIAGGWSVMMVRSGGIGMMAAGPSDTVQLVAAAEMARASSSPTVTVSFGDVGDYTDDELQRMLDRLDTWDGATSTETVTTAPIMATPPEGARQ
jgi:hypothetical protein